MEKFVEYTIDMALKGSPLGILGVIGYGVYLIWKMSVNHLHHIEKAMTEIAASNGKIASSSERQEKTLTEIKVGIEVLKDRTR
jgi:hypothetical protein